MSSDSDSYSAVEHARTEYERAAYRTRAERIQAAIDRCGRILSQDRRDLYAIIARTLADDVIPDIEQYTGTWVGNFDLESVPTGTAALTTLRDNSERVVTALQRDSADTTTAKRTVRAALRAVEKIAEAEEIVLDEYSGRVDAVGFQTQLGVHLQDREMDIGDPVRLVSERSGALKTLYSGGTGNGKSVCLEREAEDYFARNADDGDREFKIIDPAGLRDGENWLYDIPLHDDDLRDRREELDVSPTFREANHDDPVIEILLPLTPDLETQRLPFDTERESFTARPFTIPAADIRKSLLVSILTAKLTPEQESIIRDAYDHVDNRRSDWALRDLADEIRSRDELKASKRKPPVRTLRQLQNRGFIRTRDSEYAVDWRDIFESTDRYTVFSQSFLDTTIAQLIVFGYLVHSIAKKRQRMHGVPECVLVMRELWKIAPHHLRQEFDERAAQLQEAIGYMFSQLFRDNRHSSVHVLADTQQPRDLLKPVREMFNRYVVFQTNERTVRDIFEWTSNDNWKSFYNTLTPEPGEASIVGMVEPAIEERNIQFVGPVQYVPAGHHHKMEHIDATGWRARKKYLTPTTACPECESAALERDDGGWLVTCRDCGAETVDWSRGRDEELRSPSEEGVDWDFAIPTKLLMEKETTDDRPDPAINPVQVFANRCLEYRSDGSAVRNRVKEAFNSWMIKHEETDRDEPWDFSDAGVATRFGERLNSAFEGDLGQTTKNGENAWNNITFTEYGRRFLPSTTTPQQEQ